MDKNVTFVKHTVCKSCMSVGIRDADCICVYQNGYPTIELEFEQCNCCGNIADSPADTTFNDEQFNKLNNG